MSQRYRLMSIKTWLEQNPNEPIQLAREQLAARRDHEASETSRPPHRGDPARGAPVRHRGGGAL
jgi:hypothetical protein